ncbi:hypothetical protein B0H13DRAFT_2369233 [Mycena leptocephala]|nr:hypothetical protein B0H13DRAFT_2369233 [Mycena leptocephala]
MPVDYRRKFIADINDGSVLRIGIVTDTCTYGTDIPKLGRVIIAHIGDSMGDSPEVRKQQMGRPGRDGNPAVAIVYAPAWVRDVPESEVTTKQGLLDLERRRQLPVNSSSAQTAALCTTRAGESRDLTMVAKWVEFFKLREQETSATKPKTVRSDGTYPPLDTVLKASLTRILKQWRARKYNSIRDVKSTGGASVYIPPNTIYSASLTGHMHARVWIDYGVMYDWKYLDQFGNDLFGILTQVLPGYAEIIEDRKAVANRMDVDLPPSEPAKPATRPTRQLTWILIRHLPFGSSFLPERLSLPLPQRLPPKGRLRHPQIPYASETRPTDKENIIPFHIQS